MLLWVKQSNLQQWNVKKKIKGQCVTLVDTTFIFPQEDDETMQETISATERHFYWNRLQNNNQGNYNLSLLCWACFQILLSNLNYCENMAVIKHTVYLKLYLSEDGNLNIATHSCRTCWGWEPTVVDWMCSLHLVCLVSVPNTNIGQWWKN